MDVCPEQMSEVLKVLKCTDYLPRVADTGACDCTVLKFQDEYLLTLVELLRFLLACEATRSHTLKLLYNDFVNHNPSFHTCDGGSYYMGDGGSCKQEVISRTIYNCKLALRNASRLPENDDLLLKVLILELHLDQRNRYVRYLSFAPQALTLVKNLVLNETKVFVNAFERTFTSSVDQVETLLVPGGKKPETLVPGDEDSGDEHCPRCGDTHSPTNPDYCWDKEDEQEVPGGKMRRG
jgi:hypothetical protein